MGTHTIRRKATSLMLASHLSVCSPLHMFTSRRRDHVDNKRDRLHAAAHSSTLLKSGGETHQGYVSAGDL
jgi:hypothetical protein